jgi:pyrroline-5-carboxylate reductase
MDSIASRLGKIAIIGGGKMGEAILSGLVNGAMFDPDSIAVAEPGAELRARLSEAYGIVCVEQAVEITHPNTVILAVKPQVLREVCEQLTASPSFDPDRVISIAAGITTSTLKSLFVDTAVVRVMPNAPLMVGAGMSAVCVAEGTAFSEGELTRELFSLMGEAMIVDESQINAVTAISGSGPAYFALFVEELSKAGEEVGLSFEDAQTLAVQTLHGTARYLELTDASPEELRVAVTSPNGTTQAALESFAASDLSHVVSLAVKAACQRAEELA